MTTQFTDNTIATSTLAGSDLLAHGAAIGSKWPAMFAAILGAVVIFGVGFANISVAHNAAHDTRHAMVFPCH
jgi:cobalt transporter subunit CbtB